MVVVTSHLTEGMIAGGQRVVDLLDAASFPFSGALWLLDGESRTFRLMIVTQFREGAGPKLLYKKLRLALTCGGNAPPPIPLTDISLVTSNTPIVRLIESMASSFRMMSSAEENGSSDVLRLMRNTINGHYIEDALIYRLRDPDREYLGTTGPK